MSKKTYIVLEGILREEDGQWSIDSDELTDVFEGYDCARIRLTIEHAD